MIAILLLALIVLFLMVLVMRKEGHRRPETTSDCRHIALSRYVWGGVFIVLGFFFWPLLIVGVFFILYGYSFSNN